MKAGTKEHPPVSVAALLAWRIATAATLALTVFLVLRRSTYPEYLGRYSSELLVAVVGAVTLSALLVSARRTGLLSLGYAARGTIGAVLLSLLVGFGVLEAGVRLLDPLGVSYFEAVKRYQLDRVLDPLLIYRHPSNSVHTYQGVDVRFNELGLRDRRTPSKRAVKHRVLFRGDSESRWR
jgi:hypothetical protein